MPATPAILDNRIMAHWGLIKRKETWVLAWRGWFLLLGFLIVTLALLAVSIHPFLAMTRPVHGDILVIEGWMPDSALEVIALLLEQDYDLVVTTGGPLEKGSHFAEFSTSAELTAASLRELGIDRHLVVAVAAPPTTRDRTYTSALALKDWLRRSPSPVKSLDVYSLGAHARRTRLLFQKALGDDVGVGVIAADPDYDVDHWWSSSKGVRTVVGEVVAYLYARFLFFPDTQ